MASIYGKIRDFIMGITPEKKFFVPFKYDKLIGLTKIFDQKKTGVKRVVCYHHPLRSRVIVTMIARNLSLQLP